MNDSGSFFSCCWYWSGRVLVGCWVVLRTARGCDVTKVARIHFYRVVITLFCHIFMPMHESKEPLCALHSVVQ